MRRSARSGRVSPGATARITSRSSIPRPCGRSRTSRYLRAWSYFKADTAPPLHDFSAGYADTAQVELRLGEVQTEGAAGSIHSLVPIAVQATGKDGTVTVFTGC